MTKRIASAGARLRSLNRADPLPTVLSDRLLAAGALLWAIPEIPWWWRPGAVRQSGTMWALMVLAVLQSVPLLARRRRPGTVTVVIGLAALVKVVTHAPVTSGFAALLVAAYGLGGYGNPRQQRIARAFGRAAIVVTVLFVTGVLGAHHRNQGVASALLAAVLLIGEADRLRGERVQAAYLEAQRDERARIARELHDILTHQLTGIALHAGSARRRNQQAALDDDVATLVVIEAAARDALDELGSLLGVMDSSPVSSHLRAPQPNLPDLPELLAATRATGTIITLDAEAGLPRLPDGPGLAAYRITQEAVTNALNHAAGSRIHVKVALADEIMCLAISNTASPTPRRARRSARGGTGQAGMRARAEAHGGRLDAGPTPDGGYRVTAVLHLAARGEA